MAITLKINIGLLYLIFEVCRLTESFNCDRCRDANICDTVTGTFRATQLGKGYHPVVSLPRGACNVNITELGHSSNTLAIKDVTRGDYILNGLWKVDGPGVYEGAGARFYYRKSDDVCPGECLSARGPVLSQVLVQLLYADHNLGVRYTYKLPKHLKSVPRPSHTPGRSELRETRIGQKTIPDSSRETDKHPVFPKRVPIPGSEGVRHRGPIFSSDFSHRRRDSKNRQTERRENSRRRQSLTDVTFSRGEHEETFRQDGGNSEIRLFNDSATGVWTLTEGECTRPCGGGIKESTYVCVNSFTKQTLNDMYCDLSAKPETRFSVCNSGACTPQWNEGDWSECSVTCGRGSQSREVTCSQRISATYTQELEDSYCISRKPASRKQCYTKVCNNWVKGDWTECSATCGTGTRRRLVQCQDESGRVIDINHCTQSKPEVEGPCDMGTCNAGTQWYFSQWDKKCSQGCGEGVRNRNVHCATVDGPVLPDTFCTGSRRPSVETQCRTNSICAGHWFAGPWSECSASCGMGIKSRSVICMVTIGNKMVASDENECRDEDKPRANKNCTEAECGPSWYTTEWSTCSKSCGDGISIRSVKCYDIRMDPSNVCTGSDKPEVRQACNTEKCQSSETELASDCVDKFPFCERIVRERTCRSMHTQICCRSCHKLLYTR